MSKDLEIRLADDRTEWYPAETLTGTIHWSLPEAESLELRLFWYTRGKGTQDIEVIDRIQYDKLGHRGKDRFSFQLPLEPYSVAGRLISVRWALELVAQPGHNVERQKFVLSPTGRKIALTAVKIPEEAKKRSWFYLKGR